MKINNQEIILRQSLLKTFEESPKKFYQKVTNQETEKEDSSALRIGSALDCYLTEGETFFDKFEVIEVNKPWGLMGTFIENLPPNLSLDSPKEDYKEAYTKSGYKMDLNKVITWFWNTQANVYYYQYLNTDKNKHSKQILTLDEYEVVSKLLNSIKSSPYANWYFTLNDENNISQLNIIFNYKGIKFSSTLDKVIFDHNKKLILPIDLKTTRRNASFKDLFLEYRYYRQAGLYTEALKAYLSNIGMSDYTILPFKFVVASVIRGKSVPAKVWETTDSDIKAGLEGGYSNGKYYKGVNELIEELKWHIKNNYWETSKEEYENGGVIPLNVFNS